MTTDDFLTFLGVALLAICIAFAVARGVNRNENPEHEGAAIVAP